MNQNLIQQPGWDELHSHHLYCKLTKNTKMFNFSQKIIYIEHYFRVMLIITQWQTVQFGSWRELSSSGIVLGRILSKGPSHHQGWPVVQVSDNEKVLLCAVKCVPVYTNAPKVQLRLRCNTVSALRWAFKHPVNFAVSTFQNLRLCLLYL